MLVLTRRPGEQIVIGNGIRVTVVSVGPGRVKIGIEAPPDVRVDRQEIHEKLLHEQGSDVLAAVGRNEADPVSPTAIVAASETATNLPPALPVEVPSRPAPAAVPAPRTSGILRHRKPR